MDHPGLDRRLGFSARLVCEACCPDGEGNLLLVNTEREEIAVTFVRLAFFPGATREHYEVLTRAMSHAAVPAERLLFAAGPVESGWQVVQVWTSKAHLDAFNRASYLPVLTALGGSAFPAPPVVTDFEAVDAYLT